MTAVAVGSNPLADLLGGPRPAEWASLREAAELRLAGRELPTTSEEDWKYLDLRAMAGLSFGPAPQASADVSGHLLPEMVGTRQVFVNGHHAPHASCASAVPAGVRYFPMSHASEACHALGSIGNGAAKGVFEDLNTARFQDGAVILVPRNLKVALPLHLLFITKAEAPIAVFPRILVVLERGAELELVEEHHGEGAYLSCPVVEVHVAEGALLRHERVQRESPEAFHLATLRAEVGKGGQYHSRTLSFGARLSRQQPWVRLAEGAEIGLRLAAALAWFWERRGYWIEGRAYIEKLLNRPETGPRSLIRANGLVAAGLLTNSPAAAWVGGSRVICSGRGGADWCWGSCSCFQTLSVGYSAVPVTITKIAC